MLEGVQTLSASTVVCSGKPRKYSASSGLRNENALLVLRGDIDSVL